ncbi:MAG TPA: Ig-like domain-containing protein [Streptosporangiaceae bacterium]|nr:Ig-like domain-containing protein [Streptosporangiaceae bacterium]
MRGTGEAYRGRRHWFAAVAGAVCLLIAACSGGGSEPTAASGAARGAPGKVSGPSISPANGSSDVSPGAAITVSAASGTIRSVQVTSHGAPVSGTLTRDRGSKRAIWHGTWSLHAAQSYAVAATETSAAGQRVTATSSFRTLRPAQTFQTQIYEGYDQTFGVGMPVILYFSQPITHRAAVERALQLRTSKPVAGAWYWDGDKTLYFRPQNYWPAHTTVSLDGHLDGVEGAPGVYATADLTQTFRIGDSLIVAASTATHYMRAYRNGRLLYTWPISTGRPGDDTPDGTYLTIDKGNPVLMTGPGYSLEVPWSVRFTWSGDYLHDAYWSVGEQGSTNVSHGCVNMPPADAQTYYMMENPGDPVMITGSPLAGTWDNGWTVWFLSWKKLVQGSALGEAVQAGPNGSTFVSPSSVPPSTASYPLQTAKPHSAAAA